MLAAVHAWTGATINPIEPEPGVDGRAFIAYKVTGPVAGVYHYEYALYNENLDRAIQSFSIPLGCAITLSNFGFHAPLNHPGFPNDGTLGGAGFSNAPWSSNQTTDAVSWSSETFAQNQNANAIRWGTLYNFRFDSNKAPIATNATIGFFKTGAPVTVAILGPNACDQVPTPTPTPTPGVTPTPTTTPTPTPATPTPTATPSPCVIFSQNFDGVVPPALPPGWVAGIIGDPPGWETSTTSPDTSPNDAFVNDQNGVSDKTLDSPGIVITSPTAQLSFRNFFATEYDPPFPGPEHFWDGGVLEISTDGGASYSDIIAEGGVFVTGGYTGEIDATAGNPLAGRPAWCGTSGGVIGSPVYIDTKINLPASFNGQSIKLRFRMGTDEAASAPGWRIDTLVITSGVCASPTPSASPTVTPSTPTPTPTVTPASPTPTVTPATPTPTPATPTPTPATPTPTATPSTTTPTPSATATPTSTPTVTPTPTPTPTPTSASQTVNLSTRMRVQTGDNVGIGGFIITGSAPKHVLLRAIGPSLSQFGVPNALPDPVLELHGPGTFTTIINDNWMDDPAQKAAILATGLAPRNDLEAAIDATLNPGAYSAVVRGKNNATGVSLVEVYDVNQAVLSKLGNISTRAFVSTGDDIVIAGFVLGGNSSFDRILVRGIGPSLAGFGVPNALADPTLELRDNNGTLLMSNNNWQDNLEPLPPPGLRPTNNLESAIMATLPPGLYTALLAGVNSGTGVGLVEVYDLGTQ